MMLKFSRRKFAFLWIFALIFANSQVSLAQDQDRDRRQLSVGIMDIDGTIFHNVGNYIVKLMQNPGIGGLGAFANMPLSIEIPNEDFDSPIGPRIKDLLGRMVNGRFEVSGSLDVIELSNGQKIVPGYYYFDKADGYAQFRDNGELVKAVIKKIMTKTPFLQAAIPFVAASFDPQYADHLRIVYMSMRGHGSPEVPITMHLLRDFFHWGGDSEEQVNLAPENSIMLTHPDAFEFGESKTAYMTQLHPDLTGRVMQNFATPHFEIIFENDLDHIESQRKRLQSLANNGIGANPVVPILVNIAPEEILAHPNGIDWRRSKLETFRKLHRVTIFWPGKNEETDNYARVFELALGLSPKDAKTLYLKYVDPTYWCAEALTGAKKMKSSSKAGK